MRLSGLAGIAAVSVVSSLTGVARADDTKIALRISGCEAANIKADRLFELMRTELFPRQLMASEIGSQAPELLADVRLCVGTANDASITIQRSGQGVAQRTLDLSDVVGDLRTRTLAVALAEMVTSLRAGPSNSTANSVESRTLIPDSELATASTTHANLKPGTAAPFGTQGSGAGHEPSSQALQLGAGVALRQYFAPITSLLGPWISISARRFSAEAIFSPPTIRHKPGR